MVRGTRYTVHGIKRLFTL